MIEILFNRTYINEHSKGKLYSLKSQKSGVYFCHRLPWDATTEKGYFWEIILSTVYIETYYTVNGPVLLVFVSICLHNEAFQKMFASFVLKMDDLQDARKEKEYLAYIIQFHMTTKK